MNVTSAEIPFCHTKIIDFIVYRSLRQAVELFITALFCQSLMKRMLRLAVKYLMYHVSLQVFVYFRFRSSFSTAYLITNFSRENIQF